MSLADLSTENCLVVLNVTGELTDWGASDPAFTIEYIDAVATLRRGLGGNAVRHHRKNPGLRLTVNLIAGSPQATVLRAAVRNRTEISGSYASIDGLEGAVMTEGVIVSGQSMGRAGPTPNDATFVIEFNGGDFA